MGTWKTITQGCTDDGTSVEIYQYDTPTVPEEYVVFINRAKQDTQYVSRLRDGGTVIIGLNGGNNVEIPRKIGTDDRTPKLNGEDIKSAG